MCIPQTTICIYFGHIILCLQVIHTFKTSIHLYVFESISRKPNTKEYLLIRNYKKVFLFVNPAVLLAKLLAD